MHEPVQARAALHSEPWSPDEADSPRGSPAKVDHASRLNALERVGLDTCLAAWLEVDRGVARILRALMVAAPGTVGWTALGTSYESFSVQLSRLRLALEDATDLTVETCGEGRWRLVGDQSGLLRDVLRLAGSAGASAVRRGGAHG